MPPCKKGLPGTNGSGSWEYAVTMPPAWGCRSSALPLLLPRPAALPCPPAFLDWAKDPAHRGKLFLSETFVYPEAPWKGRRVMRFLTPLYWPGSESQLWRGCWNFSSTPFLSAKKLRRMSGPVRPAMPGSSIRTAIFLAHYEKDFVGQDAIKVRLERNPNITFTGLREIQADILAGKEGVGQYTSGWHRQHLGETPKLVAYTPIRFNKGLITGVTEVQDPAHNLWGVAVVAPVAEVSGSVGQVLHQELFLVGLFFIVVLGAAGAFIGLAFFWNKSLSRQVELKTEELLESQERLLRSERFAAVGEAAAYVSHEIKNPLMVIGGLANQVERRLPEDPAAQEKLRIIQNEVKRLESFLGELRDFLRPAPPSKQEIDLNQVIREVQALMEEAIREKGISLEDRLDPEPASRRGRPQPAQTGPAESGQECPGGHGRPGQNSVELRGQGRPGVVCGPGYGQGDVRGRAGKDLPSLLHHQG